MDTRLLEEQRLKEQRHDAESRGVFKRIVGGKWNGKWKVELRDPRLPNGKLWVGTFDTREMAKNAFDVVLHYLSRDTYYRISYPTDYFSAFQHGPPQDADEWKTVLKAKANEYSSGPVPAAAHVPAAPAVPSNMPTLGETAAVELQRPPHSPTPGWPPISCDSPAKPAESENLEPPSAAKWCLPVFNACSPGGFLCPGLDSNGLGASTENTTPLSEGSSQQQQQYTIHLSLNTASHPLTHTDFADCELPVTGCWPENYYRQPGGDPSNFEDNVVRAISPDTTPFGDQASSDLATLMQQHTMHFADWPQVYYWWSGGDPSNFEDNVVRATSPDTTPFGEGSSHVATLMQHPEDTMHVPHYKVAASRVEDWLEDYSYKQPGGGPTSNFELDNVASATSPDTTPFGDHEGSSNVATLRKMQDQEDPKYSMDTIDSSLAPMPRFKTMKRTSLPEFSLDKLEGEVYGPASQLSRCRNDSSGLIITPCHCTRNL